MPKAAAIPRNRLDRRKEDLAMKERVKTLTRDYFALFRDYAENPSGESSDEFTKLQANIKSRLEGLDPSGIEQFMAECYNNPDLNLRIKGQVSSVVGQGSVISTRSVCYSFEHEKLSDKDRRMVVAAVRGGQTQRAVARRFGVGLGHLQYWLARTRGQKLDQVDWSDQSTAPRQQGRQTKVSLQRRVLALRLELRRGALGFVGAQAIHDALRAERPKAKLPCLRTIGRILKRQGALDAVRRVRRAAPPAGWYLPDVAAGGAELDAFDIIEDLPLEAGPRLDVLTTRALWGSVCGAWASAALRARWLCQRLEAHWREHGCPVYAQFDNDSRFQGTHPHPDVLGQVIRVCLSLGVTPVFAPPREHGPQNLNESFNHLWQQKVWQRFHHASATACQATSDRFVAAYQQRRARRDDQAPARRPFPQRWELDLQRRPHGTIIYLRRTDHAGAIRVLGHRWEVDVLWGHRLVRAEVDLEANQIRCYRLRRHAPDEQPLVKTFKYEFPNWAR